jgi:WD40 repeat protein
MSCAILTPETPTGVPATPTESIGTEEPTQTVEVEVTETPTEIPTEVPIEPTPSSGYSLPIDLQLLSAGNVMNMQPWGILDMGLGSVPQAELAFARGGEEIAVHTFSGNLAVWDVPTGAQLFSGNTRHGAEDVQSYAALAIAPLNGPIASSAAVFDRELGTLRSAVMQWEFFSSEPMVLEGTSPYSDQSYDPKGIRSIALSSDETYIAAGTKEVGIPGGFVRVWGVNSGSLLHEIAFTNPVSAVAFSPESNELVAAVFHDLVFIDPDSGVELRRYDFPSNIHGLSYSADGRRLALEYEAVTVIDPVDGSVVFETIATTTLVKAGLSPDASLLAATERGHVRIWDVESGAEIFSFRDENEFLDIAFADHGYLLAIFNELGTLFLLGVSESQALSENLPVISPANAAALSESAQIWFPGTFTWEDIFLVTAEWVAFTSSYRTDIFEIPTLHPVATLPIIAQVSASADGRIIAGSIGEGQNIVYDLALDEMISEVSCLADHCGAFLTPDGDSLVYSDGSGVRVFELDSMEEISSYDERFFMIHVSPDSDLLAFVLQGYNVDLWDISAGQVIRTLSGFSSAAGVFGNVQFSPDWSYVYFQSRSSLQFMNVETGELGSRVWPSMGVYSPDSSLFAAHEGVYADDTTAGQVTLIDVRTDQQIGVLEHDTDRYLGGMAFSPDSRLLAVGHNNSLTIWDVNHQQQVAIWTQLDHTPTELSFSPDGRILIVRSGADVEFWTVLGDDT